MNEIILETSAKQLEICNRKLKVEHQISWSNSYKKEILISKKNIILYCKV